MLKMRKNSFSCQISAQFLVISLKTSKFENYFCDKSDCMSFSITKVKVINFSKNRHFSK